MEWTEGAQKESSSSKEAVVVASATTTTTTSSSTLISPVRNCKPERLGAEEDRGQSGTLSRCSPISLVVDQESQQPAADKQKHQQQQPTDLSNPKNRSQVFNKRNKPIPPPLDLSINANLSLTHHHPQPQTTFNPPPSSSSHSHNHQHINNQQIPNHQYQQQQRSPKFTQSEKSLPLRKRWHSWSPVPMNGQENPMVPLYPDSQNHQHNMSNKTGLAGAGDSATVSHHQNQYQPYSSPGPGGHFAPSRSSWGPEFIPSSSSSSNSSSQNGPTPSASTMHNGGVRFNHTPGPLPINNENGSLQTPTPFYTPNESSPKFMNSPVFSYSNPDASLYQGPFSPIRASALYAPPSSPFTNLSLNSPLGPLSAPGSSHAPMTSGPGGISNSCFNMIPSTLLSPAPSQASTNSSSYEDLHENKLFNFSPVWSIFLSGTKVKFQQGGNSTEWFTVDTLSQPAISDLLGIKGEYAPSGLRVRKFIVTSSAKERIQMTLCPIADPHPSIEVICESNHPFFVMDKGWSAVKPDVFQETYGTQCQLLECGDDICVTIGAARSPSQYSQTPQQQHYQSQSGQLFQTTMSSMSSSPVILHSQSSHSQNGPNAAGTTVNGYSHHLPLSSAVIKMEAIDEKIVPISVVPQTQHLTSVMCANPTTSVTRKTFASPLSAVSTTPAKKPKDANKRQTNAPGETKGRRPMNGFLLFAKDKRPELIQMFPGKDNRSISCLLGDAWKNLDANEREKYASKAKHEAELKKQKDPDCWKRKRSQSTST